MQQNQTSLDSNSSQEAKKGASNAIFEQLSDYLFEKVNLISSTLAVAGATTSSTIYSMGLRIPDTSVRQFMRLDRRIRFRCSFYISGLSQALAYILLPATLNSQAPPTSVSDLVTYIGLKIDAGTVSLVAKDAAGERTITLPQLIEIDPLVSTTISKTYFLEMQYEVTNIRVFLNSNYIGSIGYDPMPNTYSYQTFYPLIAPIVSKDGATSVNITMESYQVLQDK